MRIRTATAALVALPWIATAQPPIQIARLKLSQPSKIAELDMDKLKGQPSRLAWAADAAQLYVQTMEGNFGQRGQKLHHYAIGVADGSHQELQAEPAWASEYWTAKSGQTSPDGPPFRIDLKSEIRTEKAVSTPMGGDLARGGTSVATGAGAGDAASAAYNQQSVPVNTMLLSGAIIGQFVNSVIVPGLTFGWGPKGSRMIAFAEPKSGRVFVMDERGEKLDVPGSKEAILPAWSADGTRIAWLQRDGKKKFTLQVARVESGS